MTRQQADWRWKQTVARTRRKLELHPEQAVCWFCGDPINMELPVHHQRAFTLDHIVPIARAGHLHGETRPAHRNCNSSRGKGHNTTNTNTLLDWCIQQQRRRSTNKKLKKLTMKNKKRTELEEEVEVDDEEETLKKKLKQKNETKLHTTNTTETKPKTNHPTPGWGDSPPAKTLPSPGVGRQPAKAV